MSDVRVSRGVKRLPLMLAAGLLGAALSAAQAQPDPVHAFDWPRQPLHDALQRYSELTGDSVLYDAGHVADKTAPALSGRYSARDALQKLLAGSGLQAIYTTPRALMLRPLPAKAAPDAARLRYYGQLQARVLSALCARPRCAWANTAPPCGSRWTPPTPSTTCRSTPTIRTWNPACAGRWPACRWASRRPASACPPRC